MPPRLFLALLLISLAGCTPSRGGSRGADDDDDSAGDDDDSTAGDDDDSTAGDDDDSTAGDDDDSTTGDDDDATADPNATSHLGTLPCEGEVDVWGLTLSQGEEATIRVDTVSANTTFDPAVSVFATPDPDNGQYVGGGDDEFPCTFPPPEFSCPQVVILAKVAGTYGISVESLACSNKDGASYDLQITVDGSGRTATLLLDDYVLGGGSTEPQ